MPEPIAYVYDDTDDTLMAEVYSREIIPNIEKNWFVRVEMVDSAGESVSKPTDK